MPPLRAKDESSGTPEYLQARNQAILAALKDKNGNLVDQTNPLPVDIEATDVTVEVNLDETEDQVEVYGSDDGGTTQRVLTTDAQGDLQVDVKTLPDVAQASHDNLNANANLQVGDTDVANGNPVPVDLQASNSPQEVEGRAAEGAAAAGNPVRVAGVYQVTPTSVDDGDIVSLLTDAEGRAQIDIVSLPDVTQSAHDNFNANANLQVGDTDVADGNPVPVSDAGGALTVDASQLDVDDLAPGTDGVEVYGSDDGGATKRVLATDAQGHPQVDVDGALPAGDNNIGNVDVASAIPAGSNNIGVVDSHRQHEDGTGTWENTQGNTEQTLATDETDTTNAPFAFTPTNHQGAIVYINIDTISGTSPSLTAKIQRKDPASGTWEDVLSSGSITTTGLTSLTVHPGIVEAANVKAAEILPRSSRVQIVLDTADGNETYQYDVGLALLS